MPTLNKRQYDQAVDTLFKQLAAEGQDLEVFSQAVREMDDSELMPVLEKTWLDDYKARKGTPGYLETAQTGAMAGATTVGTATELEARGAQQQAQIKQFESKIKTGEMPDERPWEQVLAETEDDVVARSLENPKTFSLFQIAGMFLPSSPAAKAAGTAMAGAKKLVPEIAEEGMKRTAARLTVAGGSGTLLQASAEEATKTSGSFDAGDVLAATAMGSFVGAASPLVGKAAQGTVRAGAKLYNSTLEAFKEGAKKYGTWTPRAREIADNIGNFVKFERAGVPVQEATKKIKLGYAKLGEKVSGARQAVKERSQAALTQIESLIDDARSSLGFDDFEFGQTAKDVRDFLMQGVDDFAREISEKAQNGLELTKKEFNDSFFALQSMLRGADDAFSKEYGRQIEIYEELGKDFKIDVTDEMRTFINAFKSQNLFVEVAGEIRGFNPSADLTKPQKSAILRVLHLAQNPGNFKQTNRVKQLIGKQLNRATDPEMRDAFANVYQGLRSKMLNSFKTPQARERLLAESGKLLPTRALAGESQSAYIGVDHLDRLFSEYWEGSQVAGRLAQALEGKAPDTMGLTTLKNLAAEAERIDWTDTAAMSRRFTTIQPMSDEAAKLLNQTINLKSRELDLKPLVDVNKVHKQVKALTSALDPTKAADEFERVVGPLANRERALRALSSTDLPDFIVKGAKAGGQTWQAALERLKAEIPQAVPAAQRLHDRYQKFLRVNGYKANEIYENLANQGVDPQIVDDLRELSTIAPEINKLMQEGKLLEILQDKMDLGKRKAVERVQALNPKRIERPFNLGLGDITKGAATAYTLGKGVAATIGGLVKLTQVLKNPEYAAYVAEKYKLVPSDKAADWGRQTAYFLTRIRPAVKTALGE